MTRKRTQNARDVVVMMLPNGSRAGGNPFVGLLVSHLDDDITTVPFSWKRALSGRFDVFHAHWPEYLLQSPRRSARIARMVALVAVVARCRILHRKIVVTAHNRAAHDGADRGTTGLFQWFVRRADLRVFLNSFDQDQIYFREGDLVIPHGDYAAIVKARDIEGSNRDDARVIVFGSLRPYKGIESLLDLASDVPQLTIDVTGRASDEAYARHLVTRAQDSTNIELNIGEVSDADLAARIRRAVLVVLPYPDLYNSGAALLALTLRRPLLLSDSPTARELRSEFGAALVRTYSAPLTAFDISEAVAAAQGVTEDEPGTLTPRREWGSIGRRYSAAFRFAAASRGQAAEEVDHP